MMVTNVKKIDIHKKIERLIAVELIMLIRQDC